VGIDGREDCGFWNSKCIITSYPQNTVIVIVPLEKTWNNIFPQKM